MTTPPDHHEPLDAERLSDEERDLAARLGRVGPFDGPSPALDAKILAAAHAAATTRPRSRRRHLAWLGIPPAVVTGMGVAAAAVLALGLVWQLRPQYSGIAAQSEADAGEEIILIAEPSATAAAPAVNAPPAPEQPASAAPAAPARSATRPTDRTASQAASKTAVAVPAPAIAADESGALAAEASPAEAKREADAAAGTAASDDSFVAEPPSATINARRSHATYTTAARATAEQRARAAAAPAAAPAAAATEEERTTLDRIEVTGSRIAANQEVDWSQVPVSDDTHLETTEWLERIRARRDDGDRDSAKASLRLFQREYPRIRLPDDLRMLLAEAKQ